MNKTVIRRLDSMNFILAQKLDEPLTRIIAGNEIVYHHKNIAKYYGTLYEALRGLFIHLKVKLPFFDKKLDLIKPSSKESLYEPYLNKTVKEL